MNSTASGRVRRPGLSAVVAAGGLALVLATSLPGWVGRALAANGPITLGSFVSSSQCDATNCATGSTGVTNKGTGVGLYLRADKGNGLEGFSLTGGSGVVGTANAGSGVEGYGWNGVYGEGSENGVQAKGGTFGVFAEGDDYVTTISAGTSSKTISLSRVSIGSMVLATAQQSAGVYVKAAVPAHGSFTIRLTGNAPAGGLKVAYFVLN